MRKLLLPLFVIFIFLSGCSTPDSMPLPPAAAPIAASPTATTNAVIDVQATETVPTLAAPPVVNANDECKNPYYPVVDGAWWKYNISTNTTATHTINTRADQSFTITIEGDKTTFTIEGSCTDEGIVLLDVPGISATTTTEDGSSSLVTTNEDGVTLPDDIQIGDDWSQTVSVVGSSGGEMTISATIETTYKALGYEAVSTPIGLINALKVEQNSSIEMGGQSFTTHGLAWYGQGIGTVKSSIDEAGDAVLVTYNIPQP